MVLNGVGGVWDAQDDQHFNETKWALTYMKNKSYYMSILGQHFYS